MDSTVKTTKPERAFGWLPGESGILCGRALRHVLTATLMHAAAPLSIKELVSICEETGVVFAGRASKIVSDALRWEMRAGRVVRSGRGVYRFGHAPPSTQRWIAARVKLIEECLVWAEAERSATGGPRPVPTQAWIG